MTIEEARANVGQKVAYRAHHLQPHEPGQEGVITSVNDRWVFVRYGTEAVSQATAPEMLSL